MIFLKRKQDIQAGNAQLMGQQDRQNDYFAHLPGREKGSYLAVIADGLTKKAAGKYAAVISVEILKAGFSDGLYVTQGAEPYFIESFKAIGKRLGDNIYSNKTGAAVIAVLIWEGYLHYASAGNCSLYLCHDNEIDLINDPDASQIEIDSFQIRKKDIVMLCSQGASQSLSEMEIFNQLNRKSHPYDKCQGLSELIRQKGWSNQDNATIIILENMAEGNG